jgi:hypothetical protein
MAIIDTPLSLLQWIFEVPRSRVSCCTLSKNCEVKARSGQRLKAALHQADSTGNAANSPLDSDVPRVA